MPDFVAYAWLGFVIVFSAVGLFFIDRLYRKREKEEQRSH